MKVGGRSRSGDEEVPVVLVDGGVPRVTTTEVELGRPRRPRRELLLVAVAAAVVVCVGLVGGGEGGDAEETATPSTTEPGTPRRESVEDFNATSTTSRPRPPRSTTTSTVERLSGQGPMLGSATGTVLGLLDNSGGVTMLDVDTGNRCRTVPARNGVWVPWSSGIELPTMVVQAPGGLHAVDRECGTVALGAGVDGGWPAAVTGTTMWLVDSSDQGSIAEVSLLTGEETGRVIELPAYNGAMAAGDDGTLVIGVSGSMTFVDITTDERRDLGPGVPLGVRDHLLLYSSCPALDCHVATLDLDTGERHVIDGITNTMPWDTAAFSVDGRYARVSVPDAQATPKATVIDLVARRAVLGTDLVGGVFSRDGRWLIGLSNGDVVGVPLDGSEPVELEIAGSVQNIVVITNP